MKKYNIWKSWYLFTKEEEEDFKKGFLDDYLDNTNEDIDTYDENEFERHCDEVNDMYFMDDFGNYGNWKYSTLKNQKVAVIGQLGLWNGPHKIIPKRFNNVQEAVFACLEDLNEIYEDQYGNLHIEAHHHDGTNHFIIKKVVNDKLRCLHFRKEVFGC